MLTWCAGLYGITTTLTEQETRSKHLWFRPSAGAFYAVLVHFGPFWCSVVPLVTLSRNLQGDYPEYVPLCVATICLVKCTELKV